MSLVFYWHPMSSATPIACALAELAVPHERVRIDIRAGEQRTADYLAINPNGIDPNFFYGDFLLDQGDKAQAKVYLDKALAAPARPGREVADEGRRMEIRERLAKL